MWAWLKPKITKPEEFEVEMSKPWPTLPKHHKATAAATPENYSAWSSMIAGG